MTWQMYLNPGTGTPPSPPWNTRAYNISVATNLIDENADALPITISFPTGMHSFSSSSGAYLGGATTGNAAWASDNFVMRSGVSFDVLDGWRPFIFNNLDGEKPYRLRIYGARDNGARVLECRVNGGDIQELNSVNNISNIIDFHDIAVSNGSFTLEARTKAGSSFATISAMLLEQLEGDPVKSISTTGIHAPGNAIGITFTNFDGIPESVNLSVGNIALNPAVYEDDGDYFFDLPALPDSGNSAAGLPFGELITVTATDPGP